MEVVFEDKTEYDRMVAGTTFDIVTVLTSPLDDHTMTITATCYYDGGLTPVVDDEGKIFVSANFMCAPDDVTTGDTTGFIISLVSNDATIA